MVLMLFGIMIEAFKMDFTDIPIQIEDDDGEEFTRMFSDGLRESCRNESKSRRQ
jgi:hypothetical protein